jgi:hypothetical protein
VKSIYLVHVCSNGRKGSKKGSEIEKAKITAENSVDCIFYAKCVSHHEFVPEKQTENGNFYKERIN